MRAIKDILPEVLGELQRPEKRIRQTLVNKWEKIAGPKIAPHSRPSLAKDGTLYVWVDQSALAFELNQRYRQSLLKRVQAALGEEAVHTVRVKVGQLR